MKKRIATVFMLLAFFLNTVIPVFAAERIEDTDDFVVAYSRLQDEANVLTEEEKREIQMLLDKASNQLKFDFAIVTVDNLNGYSAQDFADDYYDYYEIGYGSSRDGALLLISMEDREWAISTCGYGISAFTNDGITYIGEQMHDDLAVKNYLNAFRTFVRFGNQFVSQAREGNPFDNADLPKEPLSVIWIVISIVIGFGIAKITVGSLKRQLKTVRTKTTAGSYIRKDSMNVIESKDLFLYHKVDRIEKTKNNNSGSNTHISSSGTRHGGGGGKF